jgi:crotonobetainyl-CoA:carnitine CoA-transferase CaiB-like acyl-CoA transferase
MSDPAIGVDPVLVDGAPPLAGLRVLECGDTLASAYAGRLFVDLGADVVVVEDRAGHPLRGVGPFIGASPGRDRSAGFAYFAAGKRSVCLDMSAPEAAVALGEFVAHAEVVIRSTRDGRDWIDDDVLDAATAAHPGLVVVDVSTFGRQTGADLHPTSDLLALAAGGLLSVNATAPGDPSATPLRYRGELASIHAAGGAVLAVLGALFERRRSGIGQRIDVSAQAAAAGILATALSTWSYAGEVAVHDGRRGVAPWGFFACRDGNVLLQVTEDGQWHKLVKLLGNPEWGQLEIFATTAQRIDVMDVLDPLVSEAIAPFTTAEFLAACHDYGVAAGPIHTAADLLGWNHLAARGFFQPVTVADERYHAEVAMPSPAWRYHDAPPVRRTPPPRLGEHDARPWPARTEPAHVGVDDAEPVPPPLAGMRVVDLTWVWAGPYCAMQFAHLGAEVIKVESVERLDVTRVLGPWADGVTGVDRSGYFNQYNQGKQGIVLDLKQARDREILRRLLAQADVVIDNWRAGALARMGFSYDELRRLNPRIVAVSMTGFGESGPERDHMAYGSLIDAMSGVASSNGIVGGGPTDFPMSLPDPCAGIHTAIATVAALYRAQLTGLGTRVECAMLEASVAAFPWAVLYQGVLGHEVPVDGNRDEQRAPHDVYRCRGRYEWVAIAVDDDEQFAALATAIDRADLATNPRFHSLNARRLHADELDALLSAWTNDQDAESAAARLRAAGVPAERVAHIDDLFASAPLLARHFFTELPHSVVGVKQLAGTPWITSRSPMVASSAAPCLGEHTRSVLARWLGTVDVSIDSPEPSSVGLPH